MCHVSVCRAPVTAVRGGRAVCPRGAPAQSTATKQANQVGA